MKRNLLLLFSCFTLFSCVESVETDQLIMKDPMPTTKALVVNEPSALRTVDEAFLAIKQNADKEIFFSSAEYVKGTSDNTSYYIISFINSDGVNGYSVYPASSKLSELLCFVEHGNVSDTAKIKPLALFFQNIDGYLKALCDIREDVKTKSAPPFSDEDPIIDSYSIIESHSLLRTLPVEWGQNGPLSTNINDNRGICSVVAAAQVMAYHKRDYKNIIRFNDWNDMISGNANGLMTYLGEDLYNDLYYLGTLIAPLPSRVCSVFSDDGYHAQSSSGFNASVVNDYLEDGPVILLGFEQSAVLHPDTGHYWVADGCRTTTETIVNVRQSVFRGETYTYEDYGQTYYYRSMHYNWGWGGNSNGWFASGVFQPNNYSESYSNNIVCIHIY